MTALRIICTVLLVLCALVVVVSVLMQQGQTEGLGSIAGGAETFFGKKKSKSYEGKLALATKVCGTAFIVLSLVIAAIVSRA